MSLPSYKIEIKIHALKTIPRQEALQRIVDFIAAGVTEAELKSPDLDYTIKVTEIEDTR